MEFLSLLSLISDELSSYTKEKVSQNHRALALLKKVGLGEIKNSDFKTVYAHSLVEYGESNNVPQLTLLFAETEVVNLFKDYLFAEDTKLKKEVSEKFIEVFSKKIEEKKFEWITEYYKTGKELRDIELKQFTEIFRNKTKLSCNPKELDIYNLANNYKLNSYEYQIITYNNNLIREFEKEYLKDDKYVYQNGEVELKEKVVEDGREKVKRKDMNRLISL